MRLLNEDQRQEVEALQTAVLGLLYRAEEGLRSTPFPGPTASSRRFRPRKTGIAGGLRPDRTLPTSSSLARCLSCGGAAYPAVTCHVGVNGGFEHQRAPSPLCVTAPVRRWALLSTRRPVHALPHLRRGLFLLKVVSRRPLPKGEFAFPSATFLHVSYDRLAPFIHVHILDRPCFQGGQVVLAISVDKNGNFAGGLRSDVIVSLVGHKNHNLSIILSIARIDGDSCAIFQKCHFRHRGGAGAIKSARWLAAC
jgi:hypothetical protein